LIFPIARLKSVFLAVRDARAVSPRLLDFDGLQARCYRVHFVETLLRVEQRQCSGDFLCLDETLRDS